jgi:hypothetical protein
MADAPQVKVTGAGTAHEAARLGQAIRDGVATALEGHERSLHIDTLRLQLPAGASQADIARALHRAILKRSTRERR